MTRDRWKLGCAAIRAALSNHDVEKLLRDSGHDPQAIADAFAIGQAEDVVAEAFNAQDAERRRRLSAAEKPFGSFGVGVAIEMSATMPPQVYESMRAKPITPGETMMIVGAVLAGIGPLETVLRNSLWYRTPEQIAKLVEYVKGTVGDAVLELTL